MKKFKVFLILILVIVLSVFIAYWVNEIINQKVFLTEYAFSHKEIPEAFDGVKLMQISDLHEADFSDEIVELVKKEKPDFVVITGDMAQLPDNEIGETLKIAHSLNTLKVPVYAVSGNHERQGTDYDGIIDKLWASDVYMLENGSVEIEKDGERISLIGIKDPRHNVVTEEKYNVIRGNIDYELSSSEDFSILLMHRSYLYPHIKDTGVDLILAGDLHGGIIRLPFIGGLVGRNDDNSILPKYEYGVVKEGDSATMIVSGGCDNNPNKKRYFNPPEVVMITLERKD